ncbi:hypothetical protein KIW84_030742 [Lathyrus oleraceus]|uniref:Uncharacterized protein n=1 Tax=Pisum sativum TaxID=3888 RepID=A0A9D4XTG4_PEA|nr:hypothetical protein KIW84_030742 [Pisum sativum]
MELYTSIFFLILAITIADRTLIGFLIDDKSSCDVLYVDAVEQPGLQQPYLKPYHGGDLLAFNNLITHPCGMKEGILGRSFLAKLDEVASQTLLKVTYYNNDGKPTMIHINLDEVKHIEVVIFKNLLFSPLVTEDCSWKVNMFDLDAREDMIRESL